MPCHRRKEITFVRDHGADIVDYRGDLPAELRQKHPDGVDVVLHLEGVGGQLADLITTNGSLVSALGLRADRSNASPATPAASTFEPATEHSYASH
jgi:NADPH:quinone reductase-like Zn-dependent oxidoreductase